MKKFRKKPAVSAIQLTEKNIRACYGLVNNTTVKLLTNMDHGKWEDFEKLVIKNGLTIPTSEDGEDNKVPIHGWIIPLRS